MKSCKIRWHFKIHLAEWKLLYWTGQITSTTTPVAYLLFTKFFIQMTGFNLTTAAIKISFWMSHSLSSQSIPTKKTLTWPNLEVSCSIKFAQNILTMKPVPYLHGIKPSNNKRSTFIIWPIHHILAYTQWRNLQPPRVRLEPVQIQLYVSMEIPWQHATVSGLYNTSHKSYTGYRGFRLWSFILWLSTHPFYSYYSGLHHWEWGMILVVRLQQP